MGWRCGVGRMCVCVCVCVSVTDVCVCGKQKLCIFLFCHQPAFHKILQSHFMRFCTLQRQELMCVSVWRTLAETITEKHAANAYFILFLPSHFGIVWLWVCVCVCGECVWRGAGGEVRVEVWERRIIFT